MSNQVYFNSSAGLLLNAPCRIAFSLNHDKSVLILFKDETNGFNIEASRSGFAINSRPLLNKIQELFGISRAKFLIHSTFEKDNYRLELL